MTSPGFSPAASAGEPSMGVTTTRKQSGPKGVQSVVLPAASTVPISAPMPSNWPEMSFLNRPEMSFAGGGVQERLHTAPGWWNLRRMSSQQAPIVDTGWQGFSVDGQLPHPRRLASEGGDPWPAVRRRPGLPARAAETSLAR